MRFTGCLEPRLFDSAVEEGCVTRDIDISGGRHYKYERSGDGVCLALLLSYTRKEQELPVSQLPTCYLM